MGVDPPIPPVVMKARRPEGCNCGGLETRQWGLNRLAPPCLGEALMRGTLKTSTFNLPIFMVRVGTSFHVRFYRGKKGRNLLGKKCRNIGRI